MTELKSGYVQKSRRYPVSFLLAVLCSCVKPYDLDIKGFDKIMVVEGTITDAKGPYKMQLSYTHALDTNLNEFIGDASIWIEVSDRRKIDYQWSEKGTYVSPQGFVGEPGKTYQLFVEMSDGTSYSSNKELLIEAPEIERIYGRVMDLNASKEGLTNGVQFFVDSKENIDTQYFRYEWEEGYSISTPYASAYEVLPDGRIEAREEAIGYCYEERFSDKLIYGSTIGSEENRMIEFPVRFVSRESQTLRVRYTILVRQFAITESAYLFYKQLTENNESGGSLFDKQTGSIYGNVFLLDHPNQPVLGAFEVAGVKEKREFFNNREFEGLEPIPFEYTCLGREIIETTEDRAAHYENNGFKIFSYNPFIGIAYLHKDECTDCSYYADTTKPDYWID